VWEGSQAVNHHREDKQEAEVKQCTNIFWTSFQNCCIISISDCKTVINNANIYKTQTKPQVRQNWLPLNMQKLITSMYWHKHFLKSSQQLTRSQAVNHHRQDKREAEVSLYINSFTCIFVVFTLCLPLSE